MSASLLWLVARRSLKQLEVKSQRSGQPREVHRLSEHLAELCHNYIVSKDSHNVTQLVVCLQQLSTKI